MNKDTKIALSSTLSVWILACFLIIFSIVLVIMQPSLPTPPSENVYEIGPNVYVENSTINMHSFGVAFDEGDIFINESLSYGSGTLNGYNVTNSTVANNVNFSSPSTSSSICLYGTANMTLKNVWNSSIWFSLFGTSSLHLENCSLNIILLYEHASITIKNSSVFHVGDTWSSLPPVGESSDYNTTYLIENNSIVNSIILTYNANIHVKNSTIWNFHTGTYGMGDILWDLSNINGMFENCTINVIILGVKSSIFCYGTNITTSLTTYDFSNVILNQSTVNQLAYGIIAYDDLSINNQTITGTNYENMTQEFSSSVSSRYLRTITINNSADVSITNFSGPIMLFNNANVTIFNNTIPQNGNFAALCFDNSTLTCENISQEQSFFPIGPCIYTFDNSSARILKNSSLYNFVIRSSGIHFVYNSSIDLFGEGLDYEHLITNATFINSTIVNATLLGSSKNKFVNCSITNLFEGVVFASGTLTLNTSGIFGSGTYYNQTLLINNTITTRIFDGIEVLGDTSLTINDFDRELRIFSADESLLLMHNSTFSSINALNLSKVTISNCTGSWAVFKDNSTLTSNQNCSIYQISIYNYGKMTIENGTLSYLSLEDKINVTLNATKVNMIQIRGHQASDYALKIYDSIIQSLWVLNWGNC